MRTYTWVAAVFLVGTAACSTTTRARFAATAAAVERGADAVPAPVARREPRPRVVASPVVATPRAIARDETPPADRASIGSPDAQPLRPVGATAPEKPCNATCPVMVGMPVDPACTTMWNGWCIAFCDADARKRWDSSPETFASNLPPTLSAAPIAPPVPGARLVAAPPPKAAPAGRTAAPASPAKPASGEPRLLPPASPPPASPGDLFGEGDGEECKDGSCRLPVPPR